MKAPWWLVLCGVACGSGTSPLAVEDDSEEVGRPPEPEPCPEGAGSGTVALAVELPDGVRLTPAARLVGMDPDVPVTLELGKPLTLRAGRYTLETRRVKGEAAAGASAGPAYHVASTTFDGCVRVGRATTITLVYRQEPGSGRLWVATSDRGGSALSAFDASRGEPVREARVRKTMGASARAAAVDAFGNLWVATSEDVRAYGMSTLGTSGEAQPDVTLAMARVTAVAFAPDGALWVGRENPPEIARLAPEVLARSGAPAVASAALPWNVNGVAFDQAANLWVAGDAALARYAASRVRAQTIVGGPDLVREARGVRLSALAFDAAGNLWVTASDAGVVRAAASDLAASGDLARTHVVAVAGAPSSLAFDARGALWLVRDDGVARISADGLVVPASAVAETVLTIASPGFLLFDPGPAGLPFFD